MSDKNKDKTCRSCKYFGYAMGEPQCFESMWSTDTSEGFKACDKYKPKKES